MSDTAKSGAELLPPQPATTKVNSDMKDIENLDSISWQITLEMDYLCGQICLTQMVPLVEFELTTYRLQGGCSTN